MKTLYSILLLFILSTSVFAQSNVVSDAVEFQALKDLWDNTNGASWTNKSGWPTTGNWPASATAAQMSGWYGVTVLNGDISTLLLGTNNLVGTIPTSIGNLTRLTQLRLDHNTLSGTAPASINNLTLLTQLYLSYNSLSGAIPNYGSLTALLKLSIGTNNFTAGAIPSWIGNLTSLNELYMAACNRNGSIPDFFGDNLVNLTALALTSNSISGPIPVSLTKLTNLQSCDIGGNMLSGTIPKEIGNMTALRNLSFGINQLYGDVPVEINNLHYLTTLALFNNSLTGLPTDLSGLTSLQQLNLNNNLFSGPLPTFASNNSTIQWINLHVNKFTGSVPSSYKDLTGLTRLSLNDNLLSGSIPSDLGTRTTLTFLTLQNNKLTGTIPSSLGSLVNLTSFYLSGNQLEGPIPSSFSALTKLVNFSLQNNKLSGTVPSIFSSMTSLYAVYLNNNKFTGTLPALRGSQIDVSNNGFSGEFPAIGGAAAVSVIASNNYFTSIHSGISSSTSLLKLDFASNDLSSLPSSLLSYSSGVKLQLQLLFNNNRLDFSTLETFTGFKNTSVYVPQKNIKDEVTHSITVGQSLVLTARNAGSGTVTWEKQSNSAWNQVGTGVTYTKNPATKADEGNYRWKATSASMSGTIQSEPIQVKTAQTFALDNWAFQYKYDGRKRMTHKKVPGADWVYMVYDDRDRLVMTQDGNQRTANKWMVTKYDVLNRPIVTAIYTHSTSIGQPEMSALISTSLFAETLTGSTYSTSIFPTTNLDILTQTYYDNYDFLVGDKYFEYKAGKLSGQPSTAFSGVKGQVTGMYTAVLGKDKQWLRTVNYYDDKYRVIQSISDNHRRGQDILTNTYDFVGKVMETKTESIDHHLAWTNVNTNTWIQEDKIIGKTGTTSAYSSQQIPENGDGWVEFTCSDASVVSSRTFGFSKSTTESLVGFGVKQSVTASTNRVQATEGSTTKTTYKDVVYGDVIRIERKGAKMFYRKNGITFDSTTITDTPRPALNAHAILVNTNAELFNPKISTEGITRSVRRKFDYDHAGRLINTWHSIDGAALVLLSKQEYNELGQLIDKKLHSTNSTDYRQSIDYRYNIRGWLTSMNGAELSPNNTKNTDGPHERRDLFGMDLLYNEANAGIGNSQLYNGNISAMRWSNNLGLGTEEKERAYKFDYDAMNRLTSATQNVYGKLSNNAIGWASSSAFHESGVTYDLNGNIKTLKRTDLTGATMDQLSYDYGSNETASNMLRSVSDSGTDAGFSDVTLPESDYAYDSNGNLTIDKNKSITAITYNHLNLPDKVTKSTSEYLTYTYDATGRKLRQDVYTSAGLPAKKSDYLGEWFYENDTLRFINHEEGRAVTEGTWSQSPQLVTDSEMNSTANYSALSTANITLTTVTLNSNSYLKVVSNQVGTSPGFYSSFINVVPGRTYLLRVKGYSDGPLVALYAYGDGNASGSILWPGALIPTGQTSEAWVETTFTVPANMSRVRVGALWRSGVSIGDTFYINNMELYEYNGIHGSQTYNQSGYTYQYHLKDHLGNVRMTFTTKDEKETSVANFETPTADFLYYDEAVKINSEIFDHTNTGPNYYSTRLNGTPKERFGIAKSLSVMPGDTINMQVFAKYLNPDNTQWTPLLSSLITSIANNTAPIGTFIDGGLVGSTGGLLFPFWSLFSPQPQNNNAGAPKAYLNWLIFDRNYILKDGGAIQISTAAEEHGQDRPHEELNKQLPINQAGYIYVYLSNDNYAMNGQIVEVYFDDLKIEHRKSPVIESQDYYPFGLTFNSYSRENSVNNKFLYNQGAGDKKFNTERITELDLNVDQSKYRTLDYITGRWWQVDPKGDSGGQENWSTYQFGFDNPVRYNDPEGDCVPWCTAAIGAVVGGVIGGVAAAIDGQDVEGIMVAAAGGAVAGAITGTGVGVIAEMGLGVGSAVAVNASAGFLSGAAESVTTQGLNVALGNQGQINTADVVKSAAVSTVTNVGAGIVTQAIAGKVTNAIAKTTTQQVASATSKQTQNQLRKEVSKNFPALSNKQVNKEVKKMVKIKAQNAQSTGDANKAAAQTAVDAGSEATTNVGNDAGKEKLKRN